MKKSSLKASLLLGWVVGAVWIVGVVDAQVPDQPAIPAPTVEIAQGGSQAMTYRVSLDEMYLSGKGRQKIPVQASLENLKTLAVDLILATKETVYLVLYLWGKRILPGIGDSSQTRLWFRRIRVRWLIGTKIRRIQRQSTRICTGIFQGDRDKSYGDVEGSCGDQRHVGCQFG